MLRWWNPDPDRKDFREVIWLPTLGLVAVAVMYVFGIVLLGVGVDGWFHDGSGSSVTPDGIHMLLGVELLVVPLAAFVAASTRLGADRIISLWCGRLRNFWPLVMAATLIGVCAYLVWSWSLPQAAFGPDQFGLTRWLLVLLLALFTWFWWPTNPRLIAMLAGMIAGPALYAAMGYSLFPDYFTQAQIAEAPRSAETGLGMWIFLFPGALIPLVLLAPLLWIRDSMAHALWTSGVFLLAALFGGAIGRAWT